MVNLHLKDKTTKTNKQTKTLNSQNQTVEKWLLGIEKEAGR